MKNNFLFDFQNSRGKPMFASENDHHKIFQVSFIAHLTIQETAPEKKRKHRIFRPVQPVP
jgi:hypothetical protein